ncbi:ABC transporter ATP-binding protein [Haloactinopolyspora alba]|uniref:ABC transporter ATP-binding protein n=1 Tax=Haloactinopolyspora alba TaxID=648780 RepID=UPI000D0D2F5F|nr:ABC transporter ATP-binding protein [Haloactinopolyspora alba]
MSEYSVATAVKVENVSLTYRTTFERTPTFKTALVRLGRGERAVKEVEAVQDVSFEVPHGNAVGIIGANGAGKSTLMRMIAGILPPSQGRIEVDGRVSTLLALGVGFNNQLTGRDNVILGGLAGGLTREEIHERYEDIAEFAELGEFIDMPMRTYSSGMFQRLAFSVAVHMDPDILLIDEALSAGDATFKQKAAAKMKDLAANARTMFLVSHALRSVKDMCNDAVWMHNGRLMMHGEPKEVIAEYRKFLKFGEDAYSMEDF